VLHGSNIWTALINLFLSEIFLSIKDKEKLVQDKADEETMK
jgi:hypothetical protein